MTFQKKYAVIGGAGFIGSNLVDQLIKDDCNVLVIDNLSTGRSSNIHPRAQFKSVSIDQVHPTILRGILDGCSGIYFLAARARVQPSFQKPLEYNETNVKGLLVVLEAMRMAGINKIVYSSSSSVYGDVEILPSPETSLISPMSPYGLQKYIGEEYCELYTKIYPISAISLRYFNVYGKRMIQSGTYSTAIGKFIQLARKGKSWLPVTNDGTQTRDFTHVDDVVQANIKAMDYLHESQMIAINNDIKDFTLYDVFNVGAGKAYSVNQLVDIFKMKKVSGGIKIEPKNTLSDCTKAQNILGWYPRNDLSIWLTDRVDRNEKRLNKLKELREIREAKKNEKRT